MTHQLQNDRYQVEIKEKGAELSSFRDNQTNLEYIWSADPKIWPRHAPVLFPIVGKLPGNKYQYQGQTYELPQHGIARDLNFTLLHQTPDTLVFELNSSAQTLKVYPFTFRLQIQYTLQDNALEVSYKVQNTGAADMYFSIGAHPGFNCPLLPNEEFTDYYLAFEQPETLERYLLQDGLQNGQTELVSNGTNKLPLNYDLFEKDAIVLKELQSEKITLKTDKHPHGLDFEFKGYPFFGIWTKERNAPFICLEPWHGIASNVQDTGDLTQKKGIIKLPAAENFTCSYIIRVR